MTNTKSLTSNIALPTRMLWKSIPLLLMLSSLQMQGGLFFDDPVELKAEKVNGNALQFTPTGKCSTFVISQPEVTLELQYSTGKKQLTASQSLWHRLQPLTVKLPNGYEGLQSIRLKGKFRVILTVVPNEKGKGNIVNGELDGKPISGYKLDSSWNMK